MMIFERVENEFDVSIDIDKYYKDVRNINKLAALVEKLIKGTSKNPSFQQKNCLK